MHRAAVRRRCRTWPRAACRSATSTRSGSTAPFLQALADAAPHADVVLVHAPATELCRLFARSAELAAQRRRQRLVRPLLLADDRPASVTHAYAAMKLLTQRAGLVVHDLLLGAAPNSPRAERIAMQLATCADDFLGAVLRDWVRLDPASRRRRAALRTRCAAWCAQTLRLDATPASMAAPYYVDRPQQVAAGWAMN